LAWPGGTQQQRENGKEMVKTWSEPIAEEDDLHLCCGCFCGCLDFLVDRGSVRIGFGDGEMEAAVRRTGVVRHSSVLHL